jgi:hypothetical protein
MRFRRTLLLFSLCVLACGPSFAAKPVAAVGKVKPSYMERRMAAGQPRRETYVFMAGNRVEGATVDRTFERTTFREIAEYLAPKLTKQNYWPTAEVKDADLLLVVHWGVTSPHATLNDMTARITLGTDLTTTSTLFMDSQALADVEAALGPLSNQNALEQRMYQLADIAAEDAQNMQGVGIARMLGYTDTLLKLNQTVFYTEEQRTLDGDMRSERYFIIVRAYDLRAETKRERSRPVWTLHLNTASPGNNFKTAMASMSEAGSNLFGRATEGVTTIRPNRVPAGSVKLHDIVIVGEAK